MSELTMLASSHFHPRTASPCCSGVANASSMCTVQPSIRLDIATVVFSHVQCVKTRVNLAMVSRIWRDASKTADAYPLRFDFDALPHMYAWRRRAIIRLLDNDEALSLPYERVVGLLDWSIRMVLRCFLGGVRLLKWARENKRGTLGTRARAFTQPLMDTCPFSSTCTRTGALGVRARAITPPNTNTGTACSTRWTTSARSGRNTPRATRSTSDEMSLIRSTTRVHHKQFVLFNLPLSLGHAATASISPSVSLRLLLPRQSVGSLPEGRIRQVRRLLRHVRHIRNHNSRLSLNLLSPASTSFASASSSTAASASASCFCFERFQRGELRLNRLVVLD